MRLFSRFKSPEAPKVDKRTIGNPTNFQKTASANQPAENPAAPVDKTGVGLKNGQSFPRYQQGRSMEFLAGRLHGEAGDPSPKTNIHMQAPPHGDPLPPGLQLHPDSNGKKFGGIPSRDSMPWQRDKLPDFGLTENMPTLPASSREGGHAKGAVPSRQPGPGLTALPPGWTSTPVKWTPPENA